MQIVSTMPLNPRHAKKIGFYSLFSFSELIAQSFGLPAVFAFNQVGTTLDGSVEALLEGFGLLGLSPYALYKDVDISQRDIQAGMDVLFENQNVTIATKSITSCVCGKAQYLSTASLYKTKSSLVVGDTKALCCDTELLTHEKVVIVTRPIPALSSFPEVSPTWAFHELKAACKKLEGQTLYLSRTNARHFSVQTSSEEIYHVDNDVVWMLFSFLLKRNGFTLDTLVSGMSTIRQVAVICTLAQLLGDAVPRRIYFLPRIGFKSVAGVDTLQKAIERFGPNVVRNTLLWASMSESKEFTLDGSTFPKITDRSFETPRSLPRRRDFLL